MRIAIRQRRLEVLSESKGLEEHLVGRGRGDTLAGGEQQKEKDILFEGRKKKGKEPILERTHKPLAPGLELGGSSEESRLTPKAQDQVIQGNHGHVQVTGPVTGQESRREGL